MGTIVVMSVPETSPVGIIIVSTRPSCLLKLQQMQLLIDPSSVSIGQRQLIVLVVLGERPCLEDY